MALPKQRESSHACQDSATKFRGKGMLFQLGDYKLASGNRSNWKIHDERDFTIDWNKDGIFRY